VDNKLLKVSPLQS